MAAQKQVMGVLSPRSHFINNAIDPDLNTCWAIGPAAVKLLKEHGINTTDELVGQFFMCNRNVVKFIDFLEGCGIKKQYARDCAEAFYSKFGRI